VICWRESWMSGRRMRRQRGGGKGRLISEHSPVRGSDRSCVSHGCPSHATEHCTAKGRCNNTRTCVESDQSAQRDSCEHSIASRGHCGNNSQFVSFLGVRAAGRIGTLYAHLACCMHRCVVIVITLFVHAVAVCSANRVCVFFVLSWRWCVRLC